MPEATFIYADTRFSRVGGKADDDGIKVWPLGNWAVAGFSGDVELGERSLVSLALSVEEHRFERHESVAGAAKNWLRYYHTNLTQCRPVIPTDVLLGMYDCAGDRFFLDLFSDSAGFEPARRAGVCVMGSGANAFLSTFPEEVDHITFGWAASARSGYKLVKTDNGRTACVPFEPTDRVPIHSIAVATLLQATADLIVQKADIPTVGGLLQGYCLDRTGLQQFCGRRCSQEGEWKPITAAQLRSSAEIEHRKYQIPPMDEAGVIKV
ncbi:MAG: hypothetical protein ACYSUI_17670 [Planctomycetota bacterium]